MMISISNVKAKTNGDYEYEVLDDGTVEITEYNGSDTELIIPDTIDDKKVTNIGIYVFSNCTTLTTVTIPNNIKKLVVMLLLSVQV